MKTLLMLMAIASVLMLQGYAFAQGRCGASAKCICKQCACTTQGVCTCAPGTCCDNCGCKA